MEAKELRIGNYFNVNNERYHPKDTVNKTTLKVVGIGLSENGYSISLNTLDVSSQIISPYTSQLLKYIEPIPLTEEWFKKIKTHKIDENGDIYIPQPNHRDERFYLQETFIQRCRSYCSPIANYKHITKLHEFQNFYRWDTGTELEIKL